MSNPVEFVMARLRDGHGLKREEWDVLKELFDRAPATKERVRAKQQWEHMSMLGVLKNWPSYVGEAQAEAEQT